MVAHRACPTVTTTPEAVKAAFRKEGDVFGEHGIRFFTTFAQFAEPELLARVLHEEFGELLGLSTEENRRAVDQGYRAMRTFENVVLRGTASEVLTKLETEDRIRLACLGRPYPQ